MLRDDIDFYQNENSRFSVINPSFTSPVQQRGLNRSLTVSYQFTILPDVKLVDVVVYLLSLEVLNEKESVLMEFFKVGRIVITFG